jgi:hypothetical protein
MCLSDLRRTLAATTTERCRHVLAVRQPQSHHRGLFRELRKTIRTHGWVVQCVEDDRRPYAYTIGLHDDAMPELSVTGLSPHQAGRLLNWAAAHSVRGLGLTHDQSRSLRSTIPMHT